MFDQLQRQLIVSTLHRVDKAFGGALACGAGRIGKAAGRGLISDACMRFSGRVSDKAARQRRPTRDAGRAAALPYQVVIVRKPARRRGNPQARTPALHDAGLQ